MSAPNTSRILKGALNPGPRNRLRAADLLALKEVAEEDARISGSYNRIPTPLPAPSYSVSSEPHYSTLLGVPLPDEDLTAIPEELHVWVFSRKTGKSTLASAHRVKPKALFGLKRNEIPTEYQVEFAKSETRRVAQRAAWQALLEGADRVEIWAYSRKMATSRFREGRVLHERVGNLTAVTDSIIQGEPTEAAVALDREFTSPVSWKWQY